MTKITLNNANEEITRDENNTSAKDALLTILFNKYIVKSKYITKVKYNYNYSDTQEITFYYDNGIKDKFINVPTSLGHLKLQ